MYRVFNDKVYKFHRRVLKVIANKNNLYTKCCLKPVIELYCTRQMQQWLYCQYSV